MPYNSADWTEEAQDLQRGRFLTFDVGEQAYGLGIACVAEVLGMQPMRRIMKAPRYVKGVMQIRGASMPVIDLRVRLGKEPAAYTDRTCIVVAEWEGTACGFIVDSVADILDIPDDSIALPPDRIAGLRNRYLKGVGKAGGRVVLLLDAPRMMAADEMAPVFEKTAKKKKK